MAKYLIIDGNNIGYASQHTNKLHVAGREVQAIFHFIKTIRSLLSTHRDFMPLILWDGKPQWRFDLFPEYKGDRDKDPKQVAEKSKYQEQLPDIKTALSLLGVRQLLVKNLEADDMAGYLSVKATADSHEVVLISGDKDWIQLVNDDCIWHDPKRDEYVTAGTFAARTGFATTDQYVEGKALMGDGSDNIPGVGGIGEKGAQDFMFEYESVRGFLAAAKAGTLPEKLPVAFQRFLDNKPFTYRKKEYPPMMGTFVRNKKLMELRYIKAPDPSQVVRMKCEFDLDLFRQFAEDLQFNSILKTLDVWVAPFKR